MWVFTQHGFISIVSSLQDPKVVMVRARDRKSLEQFIEALDGQDPFTGESSGDRGVPIHGLPAPDRLLPDGRSPVPGRRGFSD